MASITNNLNTGRTQTFTYDKLNRVSTAQSQATSGTDCWGETFTYDRWGNLYSRGTQQNGNGCTYEGLSMTVNSHNQLTGTGVTYDTAGNLTNDGSTAYTWDAENRNKTAGALTFDGDGWRRKNSNSGRLFWTDAGCSNPMLMESDSTGNSLIELIYLEHRLIASRAGSTVYYRFEDHLGSGRVTTSATGTTQQESDFYPFGGERTIVSTLDNRYKFTGKRRDMDTGLDYSLYRIYRPSWGRWMSADPDGGKIDDPQIQDLYAYVRNNATNLTDALGNQINKFCQPSYGPVIAGPVVLTLVDGIDFSSGFLPGNAPLCVDGAWEGVLAQATFPLFNVTYCACSLAKHDMATDDCDLNCVCAPIPENGGLADTTSGWARRCRRFESLKPGQCPASVQTTRFIIGFYGSLGDYIAVDHITGCAGAIE